MTPFSEAVTVTFCAVDTVPVVAVKVAVLWLAATLTLAGTASAPLLLLKETVVVLAAALFKVTVQVLDALLLRLDGVHDTEDSCAGAFAVTVKDWEAPFREAVSNAVWLELTLATVAVKPAVV